MAAPAGSMSLSYVRVFDRFYVSAEYNGDDYDYVEYQMNSGEPWITVPKADFKSWPIETPVLAAWSTFEFRARAVNADGKGSEGLLALSTAGVSAGPANPPSGSLSITSSTRVSDTQNRLEWSYDGSDAAYYRIKKVGGGDDHFSFDKSFILADLPTGTTQTYSVVAYNAEGEGVSASATFTAGSTGLTSGPPPADTTAPTIELNAPANIQLTVGDTYTAPAVTASDDTDGDLTSSITVTGDDFDTSTPGGPYEVIFAVEDSAPNRATVSQFVTVIASSASEPEPTPRGVLGSDVPATGQHGPSIIYEDVSLPADANARFYCELVGATPAGLILADDGSLHWAFQGYGDHEFTVAVFKDGTKIREKVVRWTASAA
ncbi:immunoglobulin-like domain-containing protein [Neptunomonas marina]|uniref:DUF5011 domain-containing protein n=1 Tax=Neptunomonas marina TaxID=1815562 RepID=A0A437QE33_9GAMM|nr:immunoglobulin-like domain-containing protein [Neptunomonas marina]RVU32705.1 DUF5011 domain-containing protein [Neptunomonas marina]